MGGRLGKTNEVIDSVLDRFKVYPNPTNTDLYIEGNLPNEIKEAKVNILNSNGQRIKNEVFNGGLKKIDVAELKSGVYIMELQFSDKDRRVFKVIITN